jgi:predicted GNAT superfamily acetyltransferase
MSTRSRSLALVPAAWEAADQAAARGGITVRELDGLDELGDTVRLFGTIWGAKDRDAIGVAVLRALSHSGNYVCGAYVEDELVGAIVGFLGWHDGSLQLHSHILGVAPTAQGRSVGFALKEHQRAWCLEREILTITWTYDPLVSRNSYFNLTKLGATVTAYYVSFYGLMNDEINGSDDSDRVLLDWSLDSQSACSASLGELRAPELESLLNGGAQIALDVGPDGEPVRGDASGDKMLVGIPPDIVELRRTSPETAASWRLASRQVLQSALDDGYVIGGMTRSGYYVVEKVS